MSKLIKDFIAYHFFFPGKAEFRQVAKEANTSSFNIYRITKGKKCKSAKDMETLYILKEKGFVKGVKYK